MTDAISCNHTPSSSKHEMRSSVRSPMMVPSMVNQSTCEEQRGSQEVLQSADHVELTVLAILLEAIKRTALSCQNPSDDIKMDIGWPTNVQHVAHVTFDRFNGFLGLPAEFQTEIPRRVPSASASVFGVSPESMQCSYDRKGNSVPTILLLLQERLYDQGGLKAEGVFRINAENSQEEHVRDQLNRGVVPHNIEVHCLAGLIKAWFRELPKGVLDSLSPEQVLQCQTEEQCLALIKTLPPTEAALLHWAINLMADVVEEAHVNKMNAHNIAMVFAPNMTQMSDPLTALMHAVQVMNLLKTLILKTLRDREEASVDLLSPFCSEPSTGSGPDTPAVEGVCSTAGEGHATETECFFFNVCNERQVEEFESARNSGETVMTEMSTTESNDEDEFSSDVRTNEPSFMDSTDDDSSSQKSRKHALSPRCSSCPRAGIGKGAPPCTNELSSLFPVNLEKLTLEGGDFVMREFGQFDAQDFSSINERSKDIEPVEKVHHFKGTAEAW